jgi:hypothetical protein
MAGPLVCTWRFLKCDEASRAAADYSGAGDLFKRIAFDSVSLRQIASAPCTTPDSHGKAFSI